jgi:sulfonate transport system substrate-binding protein
MLLNMGRRTIGVMTLLAAAGAASVFAWRQAGPILPAGPAFSMTVAVPIQLSAGAVFVAEQQKLFARHGLAVGINRFLLGKQALQAVLDGQADFAIVADTPFALAVLRGAPVATLGTVFESRRSLAIAGRRDSGVSDVASLAGKRVGSVLGTNAEFFLDTMLEVHNVERASVQVVDLKAGELVSAIRNKRVDAVTAWHPDLARIVQALGAKGVALYGEDVFVYRFLLVARQDYIDANGAQVQQLLAALRESNDFIKSNPQQARDILAPLMDLSPELLMPMFDPADFTLVLDQSLLLTLSAQMRWAAAKGLVKAGPAPDYLDFVRPEPLKAVAPDAMRIIR